jgi:hypothetical protein
VRLAPLLLGCTLLACGSSSPKPTTPAAYPPPNAPAPGYGAPYGGYPPQGNYPPPNNGYPPNGGYPQQRPPPAQGYPAQNGAPYPAQGTGPYPSPAPQAPPPVTQSPAANRPLLPPLIGSVAWQSEVRLVLDELINHLSADNQKKVRGIPLVFDPNPNEVNAFAGCDERGSPFLAGTEGLLEAVDGISQTRATDELFGTRTYDQYANGVAPTLVSPNGGSAALRAGILTPMQAIDPRRLSRAHEIFDEIVGFTFGHELGHHYLGHTGCANGQPMSGGPNPAALGNLVVSILPGLNQPNEVAADGAGIVNLLDTGRARVPNYRWTEQGGLTLLDFFARLDRAAGISVWNPIGFLRTHPNPALRIPIAQTVARTWYYQHPG